MIEKKTRAYGKVNIGLKVGGRRSDGYHDIDSYFLRIPFFDEITLSLSPGDGSIEIRGNQSYLPQGKVDIMEKAARLYMKETSSSFSLKVEIEKNIPHEAGLGGGSSDAASVLLFLNNYFKAFNKDELISFSKCVGADVPFFVSSSILAHVGGIGEIITPLEYTLPYRYVSLYRARGSGVSTKEAYGKLDKILPPYTPLPPLSYPLTRKDYPNDFQLLEGDQILQIIEGDTKEDDFSSLSGSGSVWYVLSKERIYSQKKEFLGSKEIL